MKVANFLEEEDFENLIPLIKEFASQTDVPFTQQIHEVSSSLTNNSIFVIVGKDDDIIIGYICGYFISGSDFYVSQIYSQGQSITLKMSEFMDAEIKLRGGRKILGLSKPDPSIFEPYGYKLERHLISKTLDKEEEK